MVTSWNVMLGVSCHPDVSHTNPCFQAYNMGGGAQAERGDIWSSWALPERPWVSRRVQREARKRDESTRVCSTSRRKR